ncbi:MAG: GldG family protein [Thermochromatium sp.]
MVHRLERTFADTAFMLLLLGCVIAAGWLTARHDRQWDWTQSRVHQLTPESRLILKRLRAPLRLTVFADPASPLARQIGQFLERYLQHAPELELRYLDPHRFPEQARAAEVSLQGQLLLEYGGRRETLSEISERSISAAIARLTSPRHVWVAVIEGHGERAIDGGRDADLGQFGRALIELGLIARPLDLAATGAVPDNTRLLVLTQPRRPLVPGELESLIDFIDRGGQLLWLLDPGPPSGLEPLLGHLGLAVLPGQVVDPKAAHLGLGTTTLALIDNYPEHPLTAGLKAPALLPGALAFETKVAPGWMLATYLSSGAESWNETGAITGPLTRDEVIGERLGPLPVVLALTRTLPERASEQRLVVVGDGDFLSNAHIDRQGNRALGLALVRWLNEGDDLPELPPPPTAAAPLELDERQRTLIGLGALVLLPGLFLLCGLGMRWYRWGGR